MSASPHLPPHSNLFHYNMTLGITRDGFATVINISNYYNSILFGEGFESAATADLMFFDEEGRKKFQVSSDIPPWGNLHLDVGAELRRHGHSDQAMGTIYSRLIPHKLPAALQGKRVSTELTAEIATPSGARDFIHNTGGPAYVPTVSSYRGGVIFADRFTDPCYVVLVNKYLGPRVPFVSDGVAKIEITNHRGAKRWARSQRVPARGIRFFPMLDHFTDLYDFLEGECGRLDFYSANLSHKPWIWFGARDGKTDISIDHT